MLIVPEHGRMARSGLRWSMAVLGQKTGLSPNTIIRFENGGDTRSATIRKIQVVLAAGNDSYRVEFSNDKAITVQLIAKA